MAAEQGRILVLGFGNPGRLDDGLGPAFVEELERRGIVGLDVDANYQLTVEDAALVAEYEVVIFADASVSGDEPFAFSVVESVPQSELSFSSHSVTPQAVLAMAEELFGSRPRGYIVSIRGYEYNEFGERLSKKAETNLAAAVNFVEKFIRDLRFGEVGILESAGTT